VEIERKLKALPLGSGEKAFNDWFSIYKFYQFLPPCPKGWKLKVTIKSPPFRVGKKLLMTGFIFNDF
jgi:hypothetical protein